MVGQVSAWFLFDGHLMDAPLHWGKYPLHFNEVNGLQPFFFIDGYLMATTCRGLERELA